MSRNFPDSQGHFHVLKGNSRMSQVPRSHRKNVFRLDGTQKMSVLGSTSDPCTSRFCPPPIGRGLLWWQRRKKMEPNQEPSITRSQWEPGIKTFLQTCIELHQRLKAEVLFLPHISQEEWVRLQKQTVLQNTNFTQHGVLLLMMQMYHLGDETDLAHSGTQAEGSCTLTFPTCRGQKRAGSKVCAHS